ncbi:MAG: radical SAM protein [Promethearchaeota archaeon]
MEKNHDLIKVDEKSGIPLIGIDFIGIIDRGTNIIEVKPITTCNLKCKYCFVSAGDYRTNFIIDSNYLIKKLEEIVKIKGINDIEIHIAPYGESLLYPYLFDLIKSLRRINGIKVISMQTNGLLLDNEKVKNLEKAGLDRINVSLNTLDEELAKKLSNFHNYDIEKLLKNINLLLSSRIDLLIAPVWFPRINDEDIEDIIKFVINIRQQGFSDKKVQIGIQKYLTYKTGRKLKNVRPKSWDYFYSQLAKLERKYGIKLKLGPFDFGIHKCPRAFNLVLRKGDILNVEIVSKGRYPRECIGKIDENHGIKVLLKKHLQFNQDIVGRRLRVKVIKANYKDNIITAISQD